MSVELTENDLQTIIERADKIRPLLAGLGPRVQSAILAELTATWLCGTRGDPGVTELLFKLWISTVRELVRTAREGA
jgi:hypothetical protein